MTRLPALLVLSASLSAQTEPLFRTNTDAVNVPVAVTNQRGVAISDLKLPEFHLFDNTRPTAVDHLWRDTDLPFTVGVIVDISWSEQDSIPKEREAVRQFLRSILRPSDHAFLATTATLTRLVTDLTSSPEKLRQGLDSIQSEASAFPAGEPLGGVCRTQISRTKVTGPKLVSACGGSTIWDSLYVSSQLRLRSVTGAKAIIILSDGLDTGSLHNLDRTLEELQQSGTVVYAIKVGDWRSALLHGLDKLAEGTGGLVLRPKGSDFTPAFRQIEADLRTRYLLGFHPAPTALPGLHSLRVEVTRPQARLRYRPAYYLPSADPESR